MCSSDGEYQLINPNTQVALFSVCDGNCVGPNIKWHIYQGLKNFSLPFVEWTRMDSDQHESDYFFG